LADFDLLKQVKASREAKVKAVAGDTKRFEWDRDKAARIGMAPYYSQPRNYNSPDMEAPQALGDPEVTQRGWPKENYYNDASGWARSPGESAEKKPNFDMMESKSRHAVAKPARNLP
jgi:hypothetical protein